MERHYKRGQQRRIETAAPIAVRGGGELVVESEAVEEGPQAWKVSIDEVKARGYNLDFKNPHSVEADLGDPAELLQALNQAEAKTADLRDQLKAILAEAMAR